jgi:hypothetical protein
MCASDYKSRLGGGATGPANRQEISDFRPFWRLRQLFLAKKLGTSCEKIVMLAGILLPSRAASMLVSLTQL